MPTYTINILKPVHICYKIEQGNFHLLAPPGNAPLPQQNHSLWETHFASAGESPTRFQKSLVHYYFFGNRIVRSPELKS